MNSSAALKISGSSLETSDLLRSPIAPLFSRANPYLAPLTAHERLTRAGSRKDVRHLVVDLKGSGLTYLPGDSLGAQGCNPPALVSELIHLLGFDRETPVAGSKGKQHSLEQALLREYVINRANRKFVSALAERCPQGEQRNRLMEIADNGEVLCSYIETRDYVDILKEFPGARFESAANFVALLTPVAPRLYSIASSPLVHAGEAHLCVAVVRYDTHGRPKKGLASGFLADHADMFVKNVPVYIQPARTFRLPPDTSKDIIMIGPGTGVAPFRAFLLHRAAQGATGRNWLFFGEQHRATDFLYEEDLLNFQKSGVLHRLDLAFSRDQHDRIYVQHRIREQGRNIWAWLQNGAYLYVCGDAKHMAKDVHQTLCDITMEQGGLSPDAAAEYVNVTLMKTEKRYLRDVY